MLRFALILAASPALATSQDEILSARLLPGWQEADGSRMVAVALDLAPGWKTYWRAPGDVGIPPSFDWGGSENLAGVEVHWPAPEVIQSGGMTVLGYHDRLILPLQIRATGAGPVALHLTMDLGVCDEICMPATVTLTGVLEGPGAPDPAIRAALAEVPRPARLPIACAVDPIPDGLRLTARIGVTGVEPFVVFETADKAVWVSPADTRVEGDTLVASADLVPPQGAPFALDRSGVTVTVLGAGAPVELRGCPSG